MSRRPRFYQLKKWLLIAAQVILAGLAIACIGIATSVFLGFVSSDKEVRILMALVSLVGSIFFIGCFFGARQDYRELDC